MTGYRMWSNLWIMFYSLVSSIIITGISYFYEVPGLITYMVLENQSTLHGYPLQYDATFRYGSNSFYLPYLLIDLVFWYAVVVAIIFTIREIKFRGGKLKQSI